MYTLRKVEKKQIGTLKEIWERLYNDNDFNTVFQSYKWNHNIIYNCKDLRKLKMYIYLFLKDDVPIAIVPLERYLLKKYVRFLGNKTSTDFLDFIYADNFTQQDFDNLIYLLINEKTFKGYKFSFERISTNSKTVEFLNNNEHFGINYKEECVKIPITNTFEEYTTKLSKNMRQNIRTANNKIEKDGLKVEHKVIIGSICDRKLVDMIMDIYAERRIYKYKKLKYDSFKQLIASLFHTKNRIRQMNSLMKYSMKNFDNSYLSMLKIGDEIGAVQYGLISKENFPHVMINSINQKYNKYDPGILLSYNSIRYFIENNKIFNYYDLTRGNEIYKYRLGGVKYDIYYYIN